MSRGVFRSVEERERPVSGWKASGSSLPVYAKQEGGPLSTLYQRIVAARSRGKRGGDQRAGAGRPARRYRPRDAQGQVHSAHAPAVIRLQYCGWREPVRIFLSVEVFHVLTRMVGAINDRGLHSKNIELRASHPDGALRMGAVRTVRALRSVPLGDGFRMGNQCFAFSRHVLDDIFGNSPAA
jgi:hypothetical protein